MDHSDVGSESSPTRSNSSRAHMFAPHRGVHQVNPLSAAAIDVRTKDISDVYMKPIVRTAWGQTPQVHRGPPSRHADGETSPTGRLRASSEIAPSDTGSSRMHAQQQHRQQPQTHHRSQPRRTERQLSVSDDGGEQRDLNRSGAEDGDSGEDERAGSKPQAPPTLEEINELQEKLEQLIAEKAVLLDGLNYERGHNTKLLAKLKHEELSCRVAAADLEKHEERLHSLEMKKEKMMDDEKRAAAAEDQLFLKNSEYDNLRSQYNLIEQKLRALEASKVTGKRKLAETIKKQREIGKKKLVLSLEKRLATLKAEVADLESQKNDLSSGTVSAAVFRQRKSAEMASELASIEQEMKRKHESELQELQRKIAEEDRAAQRAAEQREMEEQQLKNELQLKYSVLEQTRQSKLSDLGSLKQRAEQTRKEHQAVLATIEKRKVELKSLTEEVDRLRVNLQKEESDRDAMHRKVESELQNDTASKQLATRKAAWEKEKSEWKQNLAADEKRIQELKKEIEQVTKKIKDLAQENSAAERTAAQKKVRLDELRQDIATKKAELETVRTKLKAVEAEYESFKGRVEASQKDAIIDKLQKELKKLDEELASVETSNGELNGKLTRLEAALSAAGVQLG
jgi:DNA repair exonuclease SbcCD ATPase subunit